MRTFVIRFFSMGRPRKKEPKGGGEKPLVEANTRQLKANAANIRKRTGRSRAAASAAAASELSNHSEEIKTEPKFSAAASHGGVRVIIEHWCVAYICFVTHYFPCFNFLHLVTHIVFVDGEIGSTNP